VAAGLPQATTAIVTSAVAVLDAAAELRARLESLAPDPALQPARLDVAGQLGGLIHPGFIAATGSDRLPDVVRYLRAAARRLERLPDAVAADRDRMNAIHELESEYRGRGGRAAAPAVHWMLQELRVAQFAQGLGTRGPASAKQIRRALAASAGAYTALVAAPRAH
jgi:ATP-dependent helicase HrpA